MRNPRQVKLCHCAVVYTQAEHLLSWLEEPACSRLYLHSSPNPSFVKGGACCTFSKCELRSCFRLYLKSAPLYPKIKRSKFFVLCKIDAITHKEQTFGSLKRRLPTLLYMSLLLLRESLTALCNRGKSCKSSAE